MNPLASLRRIFTASHRAYVWWCIALIMLGALGHSARWLRNDVFLSDAGGYYVYLPSAFLTDDLGDGAFVKAVRHNYRSDNYDEYGFVRLPSGRLIFKYPMGMAVAYAPWFALAKGLYHAQNDPVTTGYEDKYEYLISLGCLAYVLLGLALLGKELRRHFSDPVAALTLLIIALGTNLFTYSAYEPLMSHGTLFMLNVLLIRFTARWYQRPAWGTALALGLTFGMQLLIRPSELMMIAVPALWGVTGLKHLRERLLLWSRYWRQLLLAAVAVGLVASMQVVFWRVVGGVWLPPFYEGESFNFTEPHVVDGLFSIRKGWLLYCPLMALSLLGIYWARRWAPAAFSVLVVLVPVYIYITFCWWDWEYGGSFGGRALISLYPLLAFGLAAFWQRWLTTLPLLWGPVVGLLIIYSLTQNQQYYLGLLDSYNMTWVRYREIFLLTDWPHPGD